MIPGLTYTTLPTGELEYCSQQTLEFFGATLEQLRDWVPRVHPDDLDQVALFDRSMSRGEPVDVVLRGRRRDGVYRWLHSRARPLWNEGRVVRWYGLMTDVTELKEAEEALRALESRLAQAMQVATVGELAAAIAHEVNQPLAAVVANAHACLRWLSAQPASLAPAREAAERIIRDGTDAGEVIRRVRSLFQRRSVERGALDVNEVLREVLRLVQRKLERTGTMVETDFDATLPRVLADRVQLQQVVLNLLQNALEAMESVDRARQVVVRSRRLDGAFAAVEVHDCGAGLKDPERVFEPFFTTKARGMGMGLAICRSIVEAHEGRIWIGRADGTGTTVSFTLPLGPAVTP
jgi:PAS domain S-box-containing protein